MRQLALPYIIQKTLLQYENLFSHPEPITQAEQLKSFDEDGHIFNPGLTKGNEWVFTRG